MGLHPFFSHIQKHLVNCIHTSEGIIPYDDLEAVLKRIGDDPRDSLFTAYARTFATLAYKNEIPDNGEFEAWIADEHAAFNTKVGEMYDEMSEETRIHLAKIQADQESMEAKKTEGRGHADNKSRGHRRGNKKPVKKAAPTANVLHSGVKTISPEEARLHGKMGFGV